MMSLHFDIMMLLPYDVNFMILCYIMTSLHYILESLCYDILISLHCDVMTTLHYDIIVTL